MKTISLVVFIHLLSPLAHGVSPDPSELENLPRPALEAPKREVLSPSSDVPDWQIQWEYAQVLSYLGRHDDSVAMYDRLLAVRPELLKAKEELVEVLFWKGDFARADELLQSLPPPHSFDIALVEAHILTRKGKHKEAAIVLSDLVSSSPKDLKLRFFLSQSLLWSGDTPGSITELRKLVQDHPEDKQLRRHLARALTIAGRHKEAAKELASSLK